MKKYLLFALIFTSLIGSKNLAAFYSPDLNAAGMVAHQECQGKADGTNIPNVIDNGYFFTCVDNMPYLSICPPDGGEVEGVIFQDMLYDAIQDICIPAYSHSTLTEIEEKVNDGSYRGICTESTVCDCRDNYDGKKQAGSCKCAVVPQFGYGLQIDYSTCFAAPTCAVIDDINGINRGYYDSVTGTCYVAPGYTFKGTGGNYEFSSNCNYSN